LDMLQPPQVTTTALAVDVSTDCDEGKLSSVLRQLSGVVPA
jgi:hypothetical protein